MQWALILVVASATPTLHAADDEPEALFRQVEKNLLSTKTVHVQFEVKAGDAKIQGTLVLGEGDRMRIACKGSSGAVTFTAPTLIGNGTKIVTVGRADTEKAFVAKTVDSPKALGRSLRSMLTRPGILLEFSTIISGKGQAGGDATFTASDFKIGAKEKIGGVETRVLEYAIVVKGKSVTVWLGAIEKMVPLKDMKTAAAKLWIDTKTNIPVKLEIRVVIDGTALEFTQTFTLDSKLDGKLFDVPK